MNRIFNLSPVPMLVVDRRQRFIGGNPAARLALRLSLADLRQRRVGDLASRQFRHEIGNIWARLLEADHAIGHSEMSPDGGVPFEVSYVVTGGAVPDRYLAAFAPAEWSEDELAPDAKLASAALAARLTPRELEILELVAEGLSAKMIAGELMVSHATVKTHLANIYEKLDVPDRASAVARAMRLGLIA